VRADLRAFAYSFLAYRPRVSPVEWAEANLSISARTSELPGPYSTRLFPYVNEPLDTFADNRVTDVVFCWGTQLAKTTTVSAGVLYTIANNPTPTLFVCPTEDNARSFSETRLAPLFESSEQLCRLKPTNSDRFKKLEWHLSNCTVNLVGSNSPANVASRPVGLLVLDECDKFSEANDKEAGTLELAVERTKSFQSARRIYCSTPTTDSGAIWNLFQQGDRRYYHVPCPHGDHSIKLEWANVKWDEGAKDEATGCWDFNRVLSSAHYQCQVCGKKITDAHKTKMLRAGKWVAENASPLPGWRSYHLSSLYSALIPFGRIAVKWLSSLDSVSGLQNFVNSYLADPWKEKAIEIKEEKLVALYSSAERGTYDRDDGGFNLMAVDVQRTYLVWTVRRFYRGMKSLLVDWGNAPWWNDLDESFARYECRFCAVDSGYGERTQEVYEQIAQRNSRWLAVKGQATMAEFFRLTKIDPFTGSKNAGQTKISLLHVNDTVWTDELLARLDGKVTGWFLTKAIDILYQRQILAVYKVEKKKRNGSIEVLLRTRSENHIFDCEKYLLALAALLGLGRGDKPPGDDKARPSSDPKEGKIEF
jgi:phage terminase large subunit GpA-like protein